MSWVEETFGSLRLRHFRFLWLGNVCASLAFFMSTVVQNVVAFDLVGSNTAVGAVVFANGLAMFVLGPLGGAVADRWPKRLVIGCAQSLPAVVFLALAAAYATGTIRMLWVAGGSFLIGLTYAFLIPARQALIVELVPPARRGNAVALQQVALTACQVMGPGVAGVLLLWQLSGAAGAYALMGLLYVAASGLLLPLPRSRMRDDARATRVLADVVAGIRYVLEQRRLRLLMLLYISVIMIGLPYMTVMPSFVERQLGRSAEAYAFLSLVSALGALTASLSLARFADHAAATALFCSMGLVFGVGLLLLATVPSYEVAAVSSFVIGIGSGGFMTLNAAVIVHATAPQFYGRVMSLTMMAFGAFGLMGLPVGVLADAVGERGALAALGAIVCVTVVFLGLRIARTPHPATGVADSAAAPGASAGSPTTGGGS